MRNAMICVSFMLAMYLAWPLVLGGNGNKGLQAAAVAEVVKPMPKPKFVPEAVVVDVDATPEAESCYKRYQREVKLCEGASMAGCRLGAADHWDMCEVTGFWPK